MIQNNKITNKGDGMTKSKVTSEPVDKDSGVVTKEIKPISTKRQVDIKEFIELKENLNLVCNKIVSLEEKIGKHYNEFVHLKNKVLQMSSRMGL